MIRGCTIIVPTNKPPSAIAELLESLRRHSVCKSIVATCLRLSAAMNRNVGLNWAHTGIVIQCDDDIEGLYDGWDRDLMEPLRDPSVGMVSARLLTLAGSPAFMLRDPGDLESPTVVVDYVPTACCAFRNEGLRFYEGYLGSGWEDTDLIQQIRQKHPEAKAVINNRCKVIHRNEMKDQLKYREHNAQLFGQRWGVVP